MDNPINLKKYVPIAIGIIISIISIIWIARNFNFADIVSSLLSADYGYLIPVIWLIVLSFALRSFRWGLLFIGPKKPSNTSLFTSLMIGYLGNNILPARAGELARIYVLNKQEGISKSFTLATVVVERTCDLLMALTLLSFVLLLFPFPKWLQNAGALVSAITLVAFVFIIILNFKGEPMVTLLVKKMSFLPKHWLDTINHIGIEFIIGLSGLRKNQKILSFLSLTTLIWAMELGILLCMAWAFYIPVTLSGILFVMIVTGLSTIIPSSPGYIGTYEFFTLAALSLIGITGNAALSFAIATHVITLIMSSIIGVICVIYTGVKITTFTVKDN
jgi:hypothetical protein